MIDRLFLRVVRNKLVVIRAFYLLWSVIFILLVIAAPSAFQEDPSRYLFWYTYAVLSGKLALLLFLLALLPGIARRFDFRHKFLAILMMFRRHIGITMYFLVIFHSLLTSLLPRIKAGTLNPLLFLLFELFGSAAATILFFLFITSNDISVERLGLWWYRLHRLIYLAMWLIFLHVALQRLSIWSVLIGIAVAGEMSSILYSWYKRPKAI